MPTTSLPAPASPKRAPQRPTVLVVDDEPKLRVVLSRFLEMHGLDAVAAASGEEAVDFVNRREPSAVLLDIRMPGMDGLVALKAIRAGHPGLPVIMITGLGDEHLMDQALFLGASEYLTKPLSFPDLEQTLASQLHLPVPA